MLAWQLAGKNGTRAKTPIEIRDELNEEIREKEKRVQELTEQAEILTPRVEEQKRKVEETMVREVEISHELAAREEELKAS